MFKKLFISVLVNALKQVIKSNTKGFSQSTSLLLVAPLAEILERVTDDDKDNSTQIETYLKDNVRNLANELLEAHKEAFGE